MKAFAIASPQRSPALPNVPTAKEGGLPRYDLSIWSAIFAPKGTPDAVVKALNAAVDKALDDKSVIDAHAGARRHGRAQEGALAEVSRPISSPRRPRAGSRS